MVTKSNVHVELNGLKRFVAAIKQEASGGSAEGSPVGVAMRQWAARYRSFLQKRFVGLSRGGGEWPPLAPSTIKARLRKNGKGSKKFKKGSVAILRDTGLLFMALSPTLQSAGGAMYKRTKFGVMVGYGGPMRHGDGQATIADIASYHQRGGSKLPRRRIIVTPDAMTRKGMIEDMKRAMKKMHG